MQPLRPKTIFEVELNKETGCVQVECCKNPQKKHGCILSYGEKVHLLMETFHGISNLRLFT